MNNQPAFPRPASEAHQHGMYKPQEGMTLRDYFAAEAMQAIVSTVPHLAVISPDYAAIEAYEYADAMLKAREA